MQSSPDEALVFAVFQYSFIMHNLRTWVFNAEDWIRYCYFWKTQDKSNDKGS